MIAVTACDILIAGGSAAIVALAGAIVYLKKENSQLVNGQIEMANHAANEAKARLGEIEQWHRHNQGANHD